MRNRNHGFDVKVTYFLDDEDGIEIRIEGEISPFIPAQGPTYSCGGQPAEGGEIEDYKIFNAATGAEIEDPNGDILDSVMDDVLEAISEDAAADQEDAREHARECREDR